MSKELADFEAWLRSACLQKPTPEAYDLAKSAWKEAIAALRSEPVAWIPVGELVAIDDGLWTIFAKWLPVRFELPAGTKLYAAPSREPTHLYQCCDCGRKSWDESDELAHCNFPQPNGKRCAGQMLPIAPSRESRTDRQEPTVSEKGEADELLREAIVAMAEDGWLFFGLEGMSDAQEKCLAAYEYIQANPVYRIDAHLSRKEPK